MRLQGRCAGLLTRRRNLLRKRSPRGQREAWRIGEREMKSGFSRGFPTTCTPLIRRPGTLFALSEKAAGLIYAKICVAIPSYSQFPSPVPEWFIKTFSSLGTQLRNLYPLRPVTFAPTTCAVANSAGRSTRSHIQENWDTKLGRRTRGHTVAP